MKIQNYLYLLIFIFLTGLKAQENSLVSKSLLQMVVHDGVLWVWDSEGYSYSHLNFSQNPIKIQTTIRDEVTLTAVSHYNETPLGQTFELVKNSPVVKLMAFPHQQDEKQLFEILVQPEWTKPSGIDASEWSKDSSNSLYQLYSNHVSVSKDTMYIAMGLAGLATFALNLPNFTPGPDELVFSQVLTDTLIQDTCENSESCKFSGVYSSYLKKKLYSLDFFSMITDNQGQEILVAGSNKETPGLGIRYKKKNENLWKTLQTKGFDTLSVNNFFYNPVSKDFFVAGSENVWVSRNGLDDFKPLIQGEGTPSRVLLGFDNVSFTATGDTTWIYWGLFSSKGLSMYTDSLYRNPKILENTAEAFYLPATVLDPETRLSNLSTMRLGDKSILIAASEGQGLYYLTLGVDSTWNNINRLSPLDNGLQKIITYPTVFDGSTPVQIGYRLKKTSKVTITIYNYGMEKVVDLVKGVSRQGGIARSEKFTEDRWDGRDRGGVEVAPGIYYVNVTSDDGESGWGKILVVKGRGQ